MISKPGVSVVTKVAVTRTVESTSGCMIVAATRATSPMAIVCAAAVAASEVSITFESMDNPATLIRPPTSSSTPERPAWPVAMRTAAGNEFHSTLAVHRTSKASADTPDLSFATKLMG